MKTSPYLKYENRLADVIAAIQVLGAYRFYKLDFAGWSDRISGDKSESNKWEKVFLDHPEFFRVDQSKEKVSLVWRRNESKIYNVDTRAEISHEEFLALSEEEKKRISRAPLNNADISMLIQSSISLHTRALQHRQDSRWWVPIAIGIIAGIVSFIVNWFIGQI